MQTGSSPERGGGPPERRWRGPASPCSLRSPPPPTPPPAAPPPPACGWSPSPFRGGAVVAMAPYTGGGRRARRAPMAEINVTPMVDVMLVLLIIFMVTAPLLVAGVKVDLPDSKAGALEQQQKPVQISLDKDGAMFVDDQRVTPDALSTKL